MVLHGFEYGPIQMVSGRLLVMNDTGCRVVASDRMVQPQIMHMPTSAAKDITYCVECDI